MWSEAPQVAALIASLSRSDLRVDFKRGCPADLLVYRAITPHGRAVLAELDDLRRADPIEAEFIAAETAEDRRAILERARLIPSVQTLLADHFGEPVYREWAV